MVALDWDSLQKKFDKKNVFEFVSNYPGQIRNAVAIAGKFEASNKSGISKIVCCGMGGSGISGRLVKELLSKEIRVPIEIVADYSLPAFVDSSTLAVIISYSGNTEESLACFDEAKSRSAQIVGIASGGKLSEVAGQKIILPVALQPRMALCLLSVPIFFVFEKYGLIQSKEKELLDCAVFLEKEAQSIYVEAKKIALRARGKFLVVYAESRLGAVAYRFRCELNENAKELALHHEFPEMNHNEINSEILPKNSCFIFIRSRNEPAQMKKRFEFVKNVFKKFSQEEIVLKGSNAVEENYYGAFFCDMVSYYLALLNKKDPDAIPVIQNLKKALSG